MTTLIESAAKTLIEVLESEKSQNVLSMKSGRALEALEQAIAQEQSKTGRNCVSCLHVLLPPHKQPCDGRTMSCFNWDPKP